MDEKALILARDFPLLWCYRQVRLGKPLSEGPAGKVENSERDSIGIDAADGLLVTARAGKPRNYWLAGGADFETTCKTITPFAVM